MPWRWLTRLHPLWPFLQLVAGSCQVGGRADAYSLDQAFPYWFTFWLTPLFFVTNIYFYWRMIPAEVEDGPQKPGRHPVLYRSSCSLGSCLFSDGQRGGVRAFFNAYLDADLGVSIATSAHYTLLPGCCPYSARWPCRGGEPSRLG